MATIMRSPPPRNTGQYRIVKIIKKALIIQIGAGFSQILPQLSTKSLMSI